VRSPADGYTLLLVNAANAINATLYDNLNYNFLRDILPVGALFGSRWSWWSTRRCRPKTVPEFIAFAKANAGKINVGSGGPGARTMRRPSCSRS